MAWTDQLVEYYKEVVAETRKVSWPTRNELRASTIVVIVSVLIVTVFVGVVDRVLTAAVGLLFRS